MPRAMESSMEDPSRGSGSSSASQAPAPARARSDRAPTAVQRETAATPHSARTESKPTIPNAGGAEDAKDATDAEPVPDDTAHGETPACEKARVAVTARR